MKKYKIIIKRRNGTKIFVEASAVSISKNRIGFHFNDKPSLWTKLDDIEFDMGMLVWMYCMKTLIFGGLFQ